MVVGATVCCTAGTVGAGVVTEGTATVGATVVTVCAGAGLCVGEGATVAVGVAVAVAGLVTTGSLEGTVAVETADDGVDVAVALLGDDELAVSVEEVADVVVDEADEADVVVVVVGSEDDVDALVDVADVSVEVAVVAEEVVVDVLDGEVDDVVSTTGTGNSVSGEDGRTGIGSPGGGSVAAGFCSTTL